MFAEDNRCTNPDCSVITEEESGDAGVELIMGKMNLGDVVFPSKERVCAACLLGTGVL
jgi:hypothetical protein